MPYAANDNIQIALIGSGGMGQGDTRDALFNPGVKVVAAADVYDGRRKRMEEQYPGIFTTRDYREILARKDVDAVIIATPDHWHARISIDAMDAGKDVYCEKPMIQKIEEGKQVIEAQKRTGRIFQVGSQYASALSFEKIRQLLEQGAIGELNMVEAWLDRNTALGAWQYSIPPDATPENVDWERFLGHAPKRPFEPIRLFRWRNYTDYGTAVAGDLYVHLLTGLHTATRSLGPKRVYSTGGLRYWKDGRDTPDAQLGIIEYPKTDTHPEFTFMMRVNFKSSKAQEDFGFRFTGSAGTITTDVRTVTVSRQPRESEPGYTIETFPKAVQERFLEEYRKKYPVKKATAGTLGGNSEERYVSEVDPHRQHVANFIAALRSRKPHFEDSTFGFRAAGPALLCNTSYYENRICTWDPQTMTAG
ncbi:MAG: Gfo/Idh/MocA family oxidoreductase [Candidatus Solibacter usitatus]|nr:Gfo/Idh/MocA family oxidoreductase [Candidatus Solibacter usitatus]